MTTVADRLVELAGGGTAKDLLVSIGGSSTTGESLTAYSGLDSAEAYTHLLADKVIEQARRSRRPNLRFEPYRPQATVELAQLVAEDELVTDLLVTLVTKGFFDGNFRS